MRKVYEILIRASMDSHTLKPDSSVSEALQLLSQRNVGAILVKDKNKLVGIFSERDYTRKVALLNRDIHRTKVNEVMSREVVCVTPEHNAEECLKLMSDKNIRHLPVIEQDQVVGFLSVLDVVNSLVKEQSKIISQYQKYVSETWPF